MFPLFFGKFLDEITEQSMLIQELFCTESPSVAFAHRNLGVYPSSAIELIPVFLTASYAHICVINRCHFSNLFLNFFTAFITYIVMRILKAFAGHIMEIL